jgi:hypothetical protein
MSIYLNYFKSLHAISNKKRSYTQIWSSARQHDSAEQQSAAFWSVELEKHNHSSFEKGANIAIALRPPDAGRQHYRALHLYLLRKGSLRDAGQLDG